MHQIITITTVQWRNQWVQANSQGRIIILLKFSTSGDTSSPVQAMVKSINDLFGGLEKEESSGEESRWE